MLWIWNLGDFRVPRCCSWGLLMLSCVRCFGTAYQSHIQMSVHLMYWKLFLILHPFCCEKDEAVVLLGLNIKKKLKFCCYFISDCACVYLTRCVSMITCAKIRTNVLVYKWCRSVVSHNTVAMSHVILEDVSPVCGKAAMFEDRIKETPVFEHCHVSYFVLLFRPTNAQYINIGVYFEKYSDVFRCTKSSSGGIFLYS